MRYFFVSSKVSGRYMNPWTRVVLNPGNQNSRTDDADRPSDADGAKRGCRVDFVGENSDMRVR
jgi:hypothetical protein